MHAHVLHFTCYYRGTCDLSMSRVSCLTSTLFLHYRPFVHRATDWGRAVSPNLRQRSKDMHRCQWIMFLRSVFARSLTLFLLWHLHRWFQHFVCIGSTINRFTNLSFDSRNDDLVIRSFVWLPCLCCFAQINLDMCSTTIIHVNGDHSLCSLCFGWSN
jgi:hypothetical protein